MRRLVALSVTTALVIAAGCGGKSYEHRLDKTLEQMRYRQKLDKNLMPAAKGKLETNLIFVRPPKTLEGPTKEFMMTVLEPGKFDVAESFIETEKQTLHVLARIKRPKGAANKKAAPEPTNRGEFVADVVAELSKTYNIEVDATKAKEETKQTPSSLNKFKHLTLGANGKTIQVYFYGNKQTPYEVALIFEYPNAELKKVSGKIDDTLGAFAVGEKARKAFAGNSTDEETVEGGEAAGPVAF